MTDERDAVAGRVLRSFRDLFGRAPDVTARAPGRVNLIGEHTDYNGGFVLPTTIPQKTTSELGVREDRTVRAWSAELSEPGTIVAYKLGEEARGMGFLDYIQGVTQAIAREGYTISGFDLRISSQVPVGGGLSSSAALEVSLLRALRSAFALPLDDIAVARLGQRAENDLVGAPVGIMDQIASSLGAEGTALFLDTRSLEIERVPIPESADVIVLSSGVAHNHAAGDYRTRRAECERAAALLGVTSLRDVVPSDLPRVEALPEPLRRRARHVVTENERVLSAVYAMRRRDVKRLGELFYASHQSMRDDFEISVPPIDSMVEIARKDPDIFGARLTGGGFGGSVVMLARRGTSAAAAGRIAAAYAEACGLRPAVLVPPPAPVGLSSGGA